MIISRKKFEEAIQKAREDAIEEAKKEMLGVAEKAVRKRADELTKNFWDWFFSFRKSTNGQLNELKNRVYELEQKANFENPFPDMERRWFND